MKKIALICLVISACLLFCSCAPKVQMPFNGDVSFHRITVTIPERFIRDSTQSHDDLWIFEHGNYSEYVLVSRSEASGNTKVGMEEYVAYMTEEGADSKMITFLDGDAVLSTYTRDGLFCQEILFPYEGFYYAVALRGGTEEAFQEICASVKKTAS